MPDQKQGESVAGSHLRPQPVERFPHALKRGGLTGQRRYLRVRTVPVQLLVEVRGPLAECRIVFRSTSQTGDNQEVVCRRAAHRGSKQQNENPHTTPHFRRSSHSLERRARISRNIIGMSHKSFISREETPASEYEISSASRPASVGL